MRHALIAALLLALAVPGCAQAEPPRPLLWKVSDADNSLYLLGSFHLLREGDYPLAASTDAAAMARTLLRKVQELRLKAPKRPIVLIGMTEYASIPTNTSSRHSICSQSHHHEH